MRQLVVVQTASQLSLLQVGSNMLVGHLLHAGLEEVIFLRSCQYTFEDTLLGTAYLFFGPRPVAASRHLAGSKAGVAGVAGVRVHLCERRENLWLMVEHHVVVVGAVVDECAVAIGSGYMSRSVKSSVSCSAGECVESGS